jgi:hypothetical protein
MELPKHFPLPSIGGRGLRSQVSKRQQPRQPLLRAISAASGGRWSSSSPLIEIDALTAPFQTRLGELNAAEPSRDHVEAGLLHGRYGWFRSGSLGLSYSVGVAWATMAMR